MNGVGQELDLILDLASRQSVSRLRTLIDHPNTEADPWDVVIVEGYRRRVLEGQSRGPWAMLKKNGPAAVSGGAIVGVLIAIIQALGQILGK